MNLFTLIFIFSLTSCSTNKGSGPYDFESQLKTIKEKAPKPLEVREESKLHFVDKAKEYGLEGIKAYNINVVDLNGDNYSDIVVIPSFYSEPEFYYFNIIENKFEKGPSPFKTAIKASYILFYDLNNDTILDAITGVLNQETELSKEPIQIFYGKRDKMNNIYFTKAETKLKPSPNSSLGLIDYNLDGKLDLFIANWFTRTQGHVIPARDALFENTGKGFKDVSDILVGETEKSSDGAMFINATPTYSVQICDMDQNGYPDILTTSTNEYKNKMWMNRFKFREKKRTFENVGVVSGFAGDTDGLLNERGGGRTFGLACADYNNDRIMDVFLGELTHNYDNEGVDKSSILTGRTPKSSPRFYRTEYIQDSWDPNWHQADRRGVWADFNNDGLLDLLVDNSGYPPYTKLIYFEQMLDHSFEDKSAAYGINITNPISTVLIDVNRDGRMDILTSQSLIRNDDIEPRLYLFENQIENDNRSMRFFLRGRNSNYHGLNATIVLKIKTDLGIEYRTQNVSYSYGALPPQNEEGVLFGIKPGEKIESVIVRWPYAKSPNLARSDLEKIYKIDLEFEKTVNITLCENGVYLVGRRECVY